MARRFLCSLVFCAALPGLAEGRSFTFELPLELQFQELGVEPRAELDLGGGFSVQSVMVYESDEDHQIAGEEIRLRHDGERISFWGGNFSPAFGQAWDQDAAVLENHAAAYEADAQMGIGGSLRVGNEAARDLRLVGNVTGEAGQLMYTLSVEVQPVPGLTLLGAMLRTSEEQGRLIGLQGELPLGESRVTPLVELAQVGDEMIVSTGLGVASGGMHYGLEHSSRLASSHTESLVQASARWAL